MGEDGHTRHSHPRHGAQEGDSYRFVWAGREAAEAEAAASAKGHLRRVEVVGGGEVGALGEVGEWGGHRFIVGDNLAVLRLLARDHAGGVQVIYIDPPYNTGKTEFTYNDRFRREGADPRDRRHAEWLSFIYPRLVLGAAWFGYGCYVYTARDVARRTTKRAAATDGQDRVRRRWAAVGVVCVAVLAVGVVWLAQPVHVELIDDCLHCYLPDL